jgi:hypothetical protein
MTGEEIAAPDKAGLAMTGGGYGLGIPRSGCRLSGNRLCCILSSVFCLLLLTIIPVFHHSIFLFRVFVLSRALLNLSDIQSGCFRDCFFVSPACPA